MHFEDQETHCCTAIVRLAKAGNSGSYTRLVFVVPTPNPKEIFTREWEMTIVVLQASLKELVLGLSSFSLLYFMKMMARIEEKPLNKSNNVYF